MHITSTAAPHAWLIENARLLTLAPKAGEHGARRGARLRDLSIIARGWVACEGDRIVAVGEGEPSDRSSAAAGTRRINALGKVVMPAFVDCHTHACWAGNRYDEYSMRLAGREYLDILAAGGGIMSTVRAVRESSTEALAATLTQHLQRMRSKGTGAIEVKSGYGLSEAAELKMLDAISMVANGAPGTLAPIIPTFLGAHAIPADNERWPEQCIAMLPTVVARFGAVQCDAFCERSAWTPQQCQELFKAARALGMPCTAHVDQFNALGFLTQALTLGVRSVAHLEATTQAELAAAAVSNTIGIFLPGSGMHLDLRFAPARRFIAQGGAPAIATNCNPGSSPVYSMPLIVALATRFLGLTHEESITAATFNAAAALGLDAECGAICEGYRSDLLILPTDDERALAYEYGSAEPETVILGGQFVVGSDSLRSTLA